MQITPRESFICLSGDIAKTAVAKKVLLVIQRNAQLN
jgi:hypothetical protein